MMNLEVENKTPSVATKFSQVERALKSLRSYGKHSYAILSKQDGAYVQVAGGAVTCIVEKKDSTDNWPMRAYLSEPKVPFKGVQTIQFGAGEIRANPDEILFIDDAIEIFRAFWRQGVVGNETLWREIGCS